MEELLRDGIIPVNRIYMTTWKEKFEKSPQSAYETSSLNI